MSTEKNTSQDQASYGKFEDPGVRLTDVMSENEVVNQVKAAPPVKPFVPSSSLTKKALKPADVKGSALKP